MGYRWSNFAKKNKRLFAVYESVVQSDLILLDEENFSTLINTLTTPYALMDVKC